jgi:hypothetical protein
MSTLKAFAVAVPLALLAVLLTAPGELWLLIPY